MFLFFFWCSLGSMTMHVWFSISESQLPRIDGAENWFWCLFSLAWTQRKNHGGLPIHIRHLIIHTLHIWIVKSLCQEGAHPTIEIESFNMLPWQFIWFHEVSSSGTFALEIIQHLRAAHVWPQERLFAVDSGVLGIHVHLYEFGSLWNPWTLTTQDWFELSAIRHLTNGYWWAVVGLKFLHALKKVITPFSSTIHSWTNFKFKTTSWN